MPNQLISPSESGDGFVRWNTGGKMITPRSIRNLGFPDSGPTVNEHDERLIPDWDVDVWMGRRR